MQNNSEVAFRIEEELNTQLGRPFTEAFDGQQEGERILFTFVAHPVAFWNEVTKFLLGTFAIVALVWFSGEIFTKYAEPLRNAAIIIGTVVSFSGLWWINKYYRDGKVFLTERRVVRFEPRFPFFFRKRTLFWANVLKTKAVPRNILLRIFKIGSLAISPISGEDEDIKLDYVYYFEDLANYIDKILFLSKHTPTELNSMKEFVLKPKGRRF